MLSFSGECGCGYVKYEMALDALHIDVFSLLPASSHGLTSHIRIRVPLERTSPIAKRMVGPDADQEHFPHAQPRPAGTSLTSYQDNNILRQAAETSSTTSNNQHPQVTLSVHNLAQFLRTRGHMTHKSSKALQGPPRHCYSLMYQTQKQSA